MATRRTKKKDVMKSGLVEDAEQTSIVKPRTGRAVKIYRARGKYNIVDGYSQTMVEPTSADNRSEDLILDPSRRARLLTLTRNLVRNSSLFNTILGQLSTNVVSTCGGKVVLSLPNEQTNKALRAAFSKWTRNADFYTGDTFNKLLKRILREYVIGGDCVVLFDDGLIEDSGKVLMFESNEIVDVPQPEVEKRYGKGAWSSQGKVYSAHGRHIGTIVSKSQRTDSIPFGQTADPDKCYYLKKDPNGSPLDNYWFHFSSNWR